MTQVISKKRVTDHGEVFTNSREVNAMLDLVIHETERIESRFLEPACGNGNFLVEILSRKLKFVAARYSKSQLEYERYAVIAVASIYGIDLLPDNVLACQKRLFNIFNAQYTALYKSKIKVECQSSVRYILNRNIIHGNALTLETVPKENKLAEPILFSEWSAVNGSMIKRRDFVYDHLVKFSEPPPPDDLFSPENIKKNISANLKVQQSDEGDYSYHISPKKDFPLVHFLEVGNGE